MRIHGVLFDMNGLFRHWHNTGARTAERMAGLPEGTIDRYAYQHPNYRLARVGLLTDQQWAEDVTERLVTDYGPDVRSALTHWREDRGEAVPDMLDLLARVREHVPVGVLSNSTDALHDDLKHHGISFDYVMPSADLGVDKPSPHAYRLAAQHMGITPNRLAYFDDEPTFVQAAAAVGLHAHHFTHATAVRDHLHDAGLTALA
ncbi:MULTISPECIES: HAD family hydrolase [Streptomyces]|uniref:HAD-superfamily hydrolase n=1 Tax=Streptomyces sp. F12 TaxID=1436084 RepID=V9Z841_9ACTN|nr:HAD-IA family hydrolase [Streptomyces sp. F12]AHE40174.1 HAD-superfamily hydrolase [Streptomyces sp. F12]